MHFYCHCPLDACLESAKSRERSSGNWEYKL